MQPEEPNAYEQFFEEQKLMKLEFLSQTSLDTASLIANFELLLYTFLLYAFLFRSLQKYVSKAIQKFFLYILLKNKIFVGVSLNNCTSRVYFALQNRVFLSVKCTIISAYSHN